MQISRLSHLPVCTCCFRLSLVIYLVHRLVLHTTSMFLNYVSYLLHAADAVVAVAVVVVVVDVVTVVAVAGRVKWPYDVEISS